MLFCKLIVYILYFKLGIEFWIDGFEELEVGIWGEVCNVNLDVENY